MTYLYLDHDIKRINEIKEALEDENITYDEYCKFKMLDILEDIRELIPYIRED